MCCGHCAEYDKAYVIQWYNDQENSVSFLFPLCHLSVGKNEPDEDGHLTGGKVKVNYFYRVIEIVPFYFTELYYH